MKATGPAFALWEGFCQVKQFLSSSDYVHTSIGPLLFGKKTTSSNGFWQFIIMTQQAAWAPSSNFQGSDKEAGPRGHYTHNDLCHSWRNIDLRKHYLFKGLLANLTKLCSAERHYFPGQETNLPFDLSLRRDTISSFQKRPCKDDLAVESLGDSPPNNFYLWIQLHNYSDFYLLSCLLSFVTFWKSFSVFFQITLHKIVHNTWMSAEFICYSRYWLFILSLFFLN